MNAQRAVLLACNHSNKTNPIRSMNIDVCNDCWNASCAADKAERKANRKPRVARSVATDGAAGDWNRVVGLINAMSRR